MDATRSMAVLMVTSCAASGPLAGYDAELRARAARDELSGVVLAARAGAPMFAQAYGGASLETCFNLASASKMFTLVAIEQLIEHGKLRREDRVGTYVPGYAAVADATIGQLLAHTAGLPAGTDPAFFAAISADRPLEATIEAVAAPLDFPPGTRRQYSNIGFLLLGRVVEVASGESFEAYVAAHIAGPAGMLHTGPRSADCATPMTGMPRQPFTPPPGTPAGGWRSSAHDLLQFSTALRDHRLISAEVGALGFADREFAGHRMIGHNGGAPGMNAEFWMLSPDDFTVIVLSSYDPPTATRIADELVTRLTGVAPPPMVGVRRQSPANMSKPSMTPNSSTPPRSR